MNHSGKTADIIRARFSFSGIVQGVGFRPFIYRLACRHGLAGFVQNTTEGVVAEVQGNPKALDAFIETVRIELPVLASISKIIRKEIPTIHGESFKIITSDSSGQVNVNITPDAAICDECLKELFDSSDRRYHYPFINCTNCGPRLTIIKDIPYDRKNTSMACFELCPECLKEYENFADRRFHAEPNACPSCGPEYTLHDSEGIQIQANAIERAAELIKEGFIIAIKGIGGFHLCVDATCDESVLKLRSRKYREEKPFAVMFRDINTAITVAHISEEEEKLLCSHQRPIVLLEKKDSRLSPFISPGLSKLGIMLAYAPVHFLLFEKGFSSLVMTSANQTDEPICTGNREAILRLKGIADYFLIHTRDIVVRCDDSITFFSGDSARIIRRSRGYSPMPIMLKKRYSDVLALGPQSKATVCLLKGNAAFLSPHIGDMETPQARDFLHESIQLMQRITECRPSIIACDMHPSYYSTKTAESMKGQLHKVQHHHAHVVSCMAENSIFGKVIGIALDGTGYGTDGTVWGGEFLVADERDFIRAGHLECFILPGGEKAVHEPWRVAVSLLKESFEKDWVYYAEKLQLIKGAHTAGLLDKMMSSGINSPLTSSMGRLFDGVSALVGIRRAISFEGQAAMELEAASYVGTGIAYEYEIVKTSNKVILDFKRLIRELVEDIISGSAQADIGMRFHLTLSKAISETAKKIRDDYGINRTVLSGGCFQNNLLLGGVVTNLEKEGFEVYHHRVIPTNDGGISLGQAVCAAERELIASGVNNHET